MQDFLRPITSLPTLGEETSKLKQLSNIDGWLMLAVLLLAAIGLATIHSASAELNVDYLPRQAVWVAVGLLLLVVVMSIDYHVLLDFSLVLYGLGLVGLALVLLVGVERGGAANWISIGAWQLQPSEFAKLATVLLLARYLASLNRRFLSLREIAIAMLIVAVPMTLVAVQPDMGGAGMFMPMILGTLLVAGVRLRVMVTAGLVAAALAAGVWTFGMQGYQRQRVLTYLSPDRDPLGAGYQVRQSKIAVGSGELLGKGYMQGTQSQLRFLPARHTDFILAVLAEEWGFVGVTVVLALYAMYLTGAARVAMRARDRAGILLVVGLLSVACIHVMYNSAMVVGLVPITGIPLPFLSYGGSFTLTSFLATGIILGVDLRRFVNR